MNPQDPSAAAVPEIGEENVPPDESAVIEQLSALHQKVFQGQPATTQRRGEHPKQHAGVWATFRVADDIPTAYRVGLFADPRSYTALVRFSNGRGQDDTKPEVHAAAVKVLVPADGPTPQQQDFIMADNPVFFARNVQHIFEFLVALSQGKTPQELAATTHPKLVGFSKVPKSSLLAMTFWSQTPYKLGNGAVKYFLTPSAGHEVPSIPLNQSPNCLREALIEQLTLQKKSASFDLCINPQKDAATMPIEDPTVEWTSSAVRLATLTIYPQRFDSPEQDTFFEDMSWSPWHALPEHAPLGGINRARRVVYEDSSKVRHSARAVAPIAPTGRESF